MYQESARWNRILGCENAADLNDMVSGHGLREFIRVNEALQERKIEEIADRFIGSGARLLLIAGPSSSGKTTFAHRLSIALRAQGLRPVKLSLDDYYRNRDELPVEADGTHRSGTNRNAGYGADLRPSEPPARGRNGADAGI